jgi:hypothetical protein
MPAERNGHYRSRPAVLRQDNTQNYAAQLCDSLPEPMRGG